MPAQTFFLVSLPTSIAPSGDRDEALTTLRSAVSTDNGTTYPFAIPEFKVGTLDALVQQADDLAKLEAGCKSVADKIADSLRSLLEGDEEKLQQQKVVENSTCEDGKLLHNLGMLLILHVMVQGLLRITCSPFSGTRSNIARTNQLLS